MKMKIMIFLILIVSIRAESIETYSHYFCEGANRLYRLTENDIENFRTKPEPDSKIFCQKLKNRSLKTELVTGPIVILQGGLYEQ